MADELGDAGTVMGLASDLMDARAALDAQAEAITGLCAIVKAQARTNTMLVTLASTLLGEDRGA